jgi:hypothetical protein
MRYSNLLEHFAWYEEFQDETEAVLFNVHDGTLATQGWLFRPSLAGSNSNWNSPHWNIFIQEKSPCTSRSVTFHSKYLLKYIHYSLFRSLCRHTVTHVNLFFLLSGTFFVPCLKYSIIFLWISERITPMFLSVPWHRFETDCINNYNLKTVSDIWKGHINKYENYSLPGCDAL